MYKRDCKEGTKVVVVMGLTRTGAITKPFWRRLADDGSYGDVGKNDVLSSGMMGREDISLAIFFNQR